tara:strand:+ start:21 stop:194 length:174 start_codon:yes stop_codon:yes gene_type:complete
MFLTIIISFLLILTLIFLMSIGYLIANKSLKGSCGNSTENPCSCSIIDRYACKIKSN